MKKLILITGTLLLLGCEQQTDKITEVNTDIVKDSTKENKYIVQKDEGTPPDVSDSIFSIGDEKYKVSIKNYTKGDFTIADTMENQITLYKENFIDITINDKTTTIDKSMFTDVYPDKNQLYHSCFGMAYIDKIDKKNKKIIFTTFFGYQRSDAGEMLYYSLSFDGKFEFIKAEIPKEI